MVMPIEFLCPNCEMLLQTPDKSEGMQATCPRCSTMMLVPAASAEATAPPISSGNPPLSQHIAVPPPVSVADPSGFEDRHSFLRKVPRQLYNEEDEEDDELLHGPPLRFSVHGALAFGWEVMKENFHSFFIAAIILALGSCLLVPIPILLAGMGALSVRAARGLQPEVGVALAGFNQMQRVFTLMSMWMALMLVLHLPLFFIWGLLFATGVPLLKLIGALIFAGGGIMFGVRLGWVPFAVVDHPEWSFSQVVEHSTRISRNRTWDLVQLAALSYFAIWATLWGLCVGILFFGVPIALGMGGSAYVLLVKDQR